MDFKDIVRAALNEYTEELRKAIDGLTAEERRFQPTPHSHHIDFVVWHMARVEDSWINGVAQKRTTCGYATDGSRSSDCQSGTAATGSPLSR